MLIYYISRKKKKRKQDDQYEKYSVNIFCLNSR